MQRLEVSCAVRCIYTSLDVKGLKHVVHTRVLIRPLCVEGLTCRWGDRPLPMTINHRITRLPTTVLFILPKQKYANIARGNKSIYIVHVDGKLKFRHCSVIKPFNYSPLCTNQRRGLVPLHPPTQFLELRLKRRVIFVFMLVGVHVHIIRAWEQYTGWRTKCHTILSSH